MKKIFKGYVEYEIDIMVDSESEARVKLFNISQNLCDAIESSENAVKRKANLSIKEITK